MNKIGFLLITDSVSGMNRDSVNLEDRIIANLNKNLDSYNVFGRSVSAKNTKSAARMLRVKASDLDLFSNKVDQSFCYIILGNTEKNYGLNKSFWFKNSVSNIIKECIFLGYEPVIVFSTESYIKTINKSYSSFGKKRIARTPKGEDWSIKCKDALEKLSSENDIRIIQSILRCPKQWDTPDTESIKAMCRVISNDIKQNVSLKNTQKENTSQSKKILVFSSTT